MLRLALEDFEIAARLDTPETPDRIFGFHVQQAAEKSLKAWLAGIGRIPPKTHDLQHLLTLLHSSGQDVEHLRIIAQLTSFAVQYRYEDIDILIPMDRSACLLLVRKAIDHVQEVVASR